jgi:hypothetical protein
LQEIAEVTQLLPAIRLLTQEVFVADIQTALHETTTLCAHPTQCSQATKIQFLLGSAKAREKFRRSQTLGLTSPICGQPLQTQQCPLTLLFNIELLCLHLELLLCATGGIGLLLCRQTHSGRFLTSLFACLLGLHTELSLLLAGLFLRLETSNTQLILRLTCALRLLERTLSELLLSLTCAFLLLLSRQTQTSGFLTSSIARLLGAEIKFCLLLTSRFLGLERGKTLLTLSLTSLLAL